MTCRPFDPFQRVNTAFLIIQHSGALTRFSSRRRYTLLVIDWSSDVFFFFSSRRRHTRLVSDWSSDVCSSDLAGSQRSREAVHALRRLMNAQISALLWLRDAPSQEPPATFGEAQALEIGRASCRERV